MILPKKWHYIHHLTNTHLFPHRAVHRLEPISQSNIVAQHLFKKDTVSVSKKKIPNLGIIWGNLNTVWSFNFFLQIAVWKKKYVKI